MNITKAIQNILNGKKSKENVTDQLYKIPKMDKYNDATTFVKITENKLQFIDTLYLPNDRGLQYALVLVDQGSRKLDVEPMKNRSSQDIVNALKKIYARKILLKPLVIVSDDGSEFKKDFKSALDKLHITHKIAKTGRHRSLALVERKNQTLGKIIHRLLNEAELSTGNASSQWTDFIRLLVDEINNKVEEKNDKVEDIPLSEQEIKFNPNKKTDMLSINDKVRVALDNPQDVKGKRLNGKFRSSDIRYDPKIRIVKEVLMEPLQPIMYLLDGDVGQLLIEPVAYTRNQLHKVSANENVAKTSLVIDPNRYEVQSLLDRRKNGRSIEYKVKWKNYRETTWEKRTQLIKDIRQLIEKYDKENA